MSFSLDTITLKSFMAIAETGTFSEAANVVGRTQAALSQQIKKLEDHLGCRLFERKQRKVTLTDAGEVFLGYARQMLQLQRDAFSRLREPDIAGEIRFGTPEDFASHYLPDILASFRAHHPRVQLNVECDLTLNLMNGFRRGKYDMVLVKRDPQRVTGGTKFWREPLVWAAVDGYKVEEPLALVLSPQPCIYRARALAALDRAHKPWRIAYTSPSLAGTLAAVKAGLGMTLLPSAMIPDGIRALRSAQKLPHLADAEIALLKRDGLPKAAEMLAAHIVENMEKRHRR